MKRFIFVVVMTGVVGGMIGGVGLVRGQAISARKVSPNLEGRMDAALRYRPEGEDFVVENGGEFFNRPLYGGNTAFRVDAGDKPEFTMYLPGRGGNLRLGVRASGGGAKWLNGAEKIEARYRPGGMIYEVRDPVLGTNASIHVEVFALAVTEGLVVKVEGRGTEAGLELIWAYGGVNGQRGARDGDIGTERVPISEYFQLTPDFCKGNTFEIGTGAFTLKSTAATIFGRMPADAKLQIGDARQWGNAEALLSSAKGAAAAGDLSVMVGRAPLAAGAARYLSLQRLGTGSAAAAELQTYQDVTASRPAETAPPAPAAKLLGAFGESDLPKVFDQAAAHFKALRERVTVDTPDPYLNAAVGALNVAADAVWDDAQGAVMHGAIAWRTKLLGWRGPYAMDELGWHDRAQMDFEYWAGRQNTKAIPAAVPPADEAQNLSRNEAGLHTNGDISNSHYDMNLVHIDAVFRHILWTGDLEFARKEWPVIERHLAWEQRLFRREYGPEKLPLYEAYAAIWASDDLEYDGGGTAHASAYNYYHNVMAARVAKAIGKDPAPYEKEAALILKGMHAYLWLADKGLYAEFRDYLGLQLAHGDAGLWTFYHTIDSDAATPMEAWQMSRFVDAMPHIPVKGPGVPADEPYAMLPTTTWMPYLWSLNNVCMNENAHTALAYFQAGRSAEGTRLLKSSILASMYMGISPGNVGTMNYLDVYRRESQRDFGDGSGTLSRTVVEGLFGIKADGLAGVLQVRPGFSEGWDHASIVHPDVSFAWKRTGQTDTFTVESHFSRPMALRLDWVAHCDDVASVTVNGQAAKWSQPEDAVGVPHIVIAAPAAPQWEISLEWKGNVIPPYTPMVTKATEGQMNMLNASFEGAQAVSPRLLDPQHVLTPVGAQPADGGVNAQITGVSGSHTVFVHIKQAAFTWWVPMDFEIAARETATAPPMNWAKADAAAKYETVDLAKFFNDQVTQIFKHEYRAPRSPFVSLAIPKQGIGAWAGEVKATAEIDDRGLRAVAAKNGGKLLMPNGAPFATPGPGAGKNVVFTSQWENFPKEVTVPLAGRARRVMLLMAGSTNPMQSRFDNGEVVVTYKDGTMARLALENPTNWWPIEQDYFIDDYQFRRPEGIPPRVDLSTGQVRLLDVATFKGKGGKINGGAATVLDLALDTSKDLASVTVRTLANEVVVGLMGVTLVR